MIDLDDSTGESLYWVSQPLPGHMLAGGMAASVQPFDSAAAIRPVIASQERQTRFRQEAKAASSLNHPNIITVYEIDRAGDATFIATEFIDGTTLDQVIPRQGLRFPDELQYAV